MKTLVLGLGLASAGCLGLGYRGDVGIAHGKTDRVIIDAAAGLDTRSYQRASDDDDALLVFWGIGGRITKRLDNGLVSGGPLTGFGVSYFHGRYGVVALGTIGALFNAGHHTEGIAARFQLGVEIEGGESDWRITARPSRDCGGYIDTPNVAVNRTHYLFGVLPGIEAFGGGGGRSVSLAVSFREVAEPGICAGIGP